MNSNSKYVVIVDGYSSGNLLPDEFKKRGFQAIHVQSTPTIWPILKLTYRPQDYSFHFAFDSNFETLVFDLESFNLVGVLAGTETGVELADRLSHALKLPGNGISFSEARRNKYLMIEAVRNAGLTAALQIRSHNADEIALWFLKNNLHKIIIKPLKSAGTDSVYTCFTASEILQACSKILGTHNKLGIWNEQVLAQEFLEGQEFALDSVSVNGRVHFTAIWKYHKKQINGASFIYDFDELVSSSDETGKILCDYTNQVMKALQITHGPSHTEVMLTAKGPVLVEIGTRLNGTTVAKVNDQSIGYGQLDLTADAYVDTAAFDSKSHEPYRIRKHVYSVALISQTTGKIKAVPAEKIFPQLSSYCEMYLRAKPGYEMKPTVDFYTHPGFVMLVHCDQAVLKSDLVTVRQLEKDRKLYELE